MKPTFLIYYILICLLVLAGCTQSQPKKPIYCPNEVLLFSAPDSWEKIGLNTDKSSWGFVQNLYDSLKADVCDTTVYLGIQLDNQRMVKCWADKNCDKVIECFLQRPKVLVLAGKHARLLVGLDTIPVDSLKQYIFQTFTDPANKDTEEVTLRWNAGTSAKLLDKTIEQIVAGYLLLYRKLAQTHYKKDLCELTKEQTGYLKKELPFSLCLNGKAYPPPPPGVIPEMKVMPDIP